MQVRTMAAAGWMPAPAQRLARALAWLRAAPGWGGLLLALALAAPVPLFMAFARNAVINYTHHDVFIPLDAGWRTLQGQWPHSDYYTPLGLSYVWLHGAAAWLWGMDGRVVIWANLLALPLVLGPALLLAWRRLNVFHTVVVTVLLAVVVTSPVFLDGPERLIAHLADYNRIGGGLCAVACLWALCPPRPGGRAFAVIEALAMGLAFLVLLYLKVTFFVLAVVIAGAGCATVAGTWRRAIPAAAVALAGVAVLELLHPGLLSGYVADVRRAGAANTQVFRGFYTPQAVFVNLPMCILIGALGTAVAWLGRRQLLPVAGLAVVAGACVLVATQNFGAFSPPLVMLVVLLAGRLEGVQAEAEQHSGLNAGVLAAAGMFAVLLAVAPFLETHLAGTVYQATTSREKAVALGGGRSTTLQTVLWLPNPLERAFIPEHATPDEARRWQAAPPAALAAAVLADGLELLTANGLSGRRIASMSFSNPFPVALRAPPPRGGALWWDVDRTFTAAKVTPEMVLGDAEIVMVPKLWWALPVVDALMGVVQEPLRQGFIPHESRYWTAWERQAP